MAKVVGNKIGVKVLFAFLCCFTANAQKVDTLSTSPKTNGPLMGQLIINGDTVAWSVLDEVLFVAKPTLNDVQARRNYYALMKKVGRVYPYVREAALRMDSVNMQLEGIDRKRQRRKYTKSYQKYLEERFEPELRKLTRSEGQILSKLVFRETNTSVYEIIKTYRNGLSARFWSMTAWWYDIDLKRPYDPENDAEDRLIENILLRKFIAGELVPARAEERILYQR
jgi:hypothetical protein